MNIGAESSVIKKESTKTGTQSYTRILKSVVLGIILALFVSIILLLVFAFIINGAFGDPDSVMNTFTVIAASVGAAAGGFYASKSNGSKGLVCGLSTGAGMNIVLFLAMIFAGTMNSENASMGFRLAMVVCQLIFACIGGVFAVNTHSSKKTSYRSISKRK